MTSIEWNEEKKYGIVSRPKVTMIRQQTPRPKLGFDFESVELETLAKEMPELTAGRIEEAVIVQLNQYFKQLGGAHHNTKKSWHKEQIISN